MVTVFAGSWSFVSSNALLFATCHFFFSRLPPASLTGGIHWKFPLLRIFPSYTFFFVARFGMFKVTSSHPAAPFSPLRRGPPNGLFPPASFLPVLPSRFWFFSPGLLGCFLPFGSQGISLFFFFHEIPFFFCLNTHSHCLSRLLEFFFWTFVTSCGVFVVPTCLFRVFAALFVPASFHSLLCVKR